MALLKFNKGLYAALPTTKTEGHVYITTDQQAMYVDISNTERIRIRQIVTYGTFAEFQEALQKNKVPYDASDFYYIENANALLKWVSTSGTTVLPDGDATDGGTSVTGTWKQINSTAAVEAALATLAEEVHGTNGEGGLKGDLAALSKKVNDLEVVGGQANKVEGALANGEAVTIDGNKNLVLGALAVKNTIGTADIDDSAVTEAKINAGAVTSEKIGANAVSEAKIADNAVTENKLAEDLKTKINTASTAAGDNAAAIAALKTTVNGSDGVSGLVKDVADLKAIDNATQAELDAYKTTVTNAISTAKSEATTDAVNQAKAIIGEGYDSENTVKKAIDNLSAAVGNGEGALGSRVAALEATVDTATTGLKDRVKALEDVDNVTQAEWTELKSGLDTQISQAQSAAQTGAVADVKKILGGSYSETATVSADIENIKTIISDTNGLGKEIDDVAGRVDTLEGLVGKTENDGLRKEVADVKAAIGENGLAGELDALAEKIGTGSLSEGSASTIVDQVNANTAGVANNAAAILKLNQDIGNLSNVMNFRGVSTTNPIDEVDEDGDVVTDGKVTIGGTEVTDFADGDVILYEGKEFVYSNGAWHEFGDASVNGALIEALDGRVTENAGDILALETKVGSEAITTGATISAQVNANTVAINNLSTEVATNYYTKDEINALLEWGTFTIAAQ